MGTIKIEHPLSINVGAGSAYENFQNKFAIKVKLFKLRAG